MQVKNLLTCVTQSLKYEPVLTDLAVALNRSCMQAC